MFLTKTFVSISGVVSHDQKEEMSSYSNSQFESIDALKPFHCPSCPSTFFEQHELKAHISQNHGDQMPFRCQVCGKGYLSARGLNHHSSLHTGQLFACPICDRKMHRKDSMKLHLRRVHKSEQCSNCTQVFPAETFKLHIASCLQMCVD